MPPPIAPAQQRNYAQDLAQRGSLNLHRLSSSSRQALQGAGVSDADLQQIAGQDGVIRGEEFQQLFSLLEGRSDTSTRRSGNVNRAEQVYQAIRGDVTTDATENGSSPTNDTPQSPADPSRYGVGLRSDLTMGEPRRAAQAHGQVRSVEVRASSPELSSDEVATPQELIVGSVGSFDMVAMLLHAGDPDSAARLLEEGAAELAARVPELSGPERTVLTEVARNMRARAALYRADGPQNVRAAAGSLASVARPTLRTAESLRDENADYAQLLTNVHADSMSQAQLGADAAANSAAMLGLGVSTMYRNIAVGSIETDIANSGVIHNALTGSRDALEEDLAKMHAVFDHLDGLIQENGMSFDEAWEAMSADHTTTDRDLPGYGPGFAAMWMRDHDSTRGLLRPMSHLSRGLQTGDAAQVDAARGELVEALRASDQWDIAGQVLDDYQANAQSDAGRTEAQALADNENREYYQDAALEFARRELPLLLLSGAISGGAGYGARALATTAGWGARAAKGAQIAVEIGTMVPTERILNDTINDERADWSAGALARDYALTAGSFALFRVMGAGWRALRSTRARPTRGAGYRDGPPAKPGKNDRAPENLRALSRENESATALADAGYGVQQNPPVPGGHARGIKRPDYRINGHLFDNYAPGGTKDTARKIWQHLDGEKLNPKPKLNRDGSIRKPAKARQAERIVLNMSDSPVTDQALRRQFADYPMDGLQQLVVVRGSEVTEIPLARTLAETPWVTPKGYPISGDVSVPPSAVQVPQAEPQHARP